MWENGICDVKFGLMNRLAMRNPDPRGIWVPSNQILVDLRHLRSDNSRHEDLYVVVGGHHLNDATMDIMISSSLSHSCLQKS